MARTRPMDFSDAVVSMEDTISGLSFHEMNAVYSLLKDRHGRIQIDTAADFHIGQRVSFMTKRGIRVEGAIDRINRKTIGLSNCTDGVGWRVSPSILSVV